MSFGDVFYISTVVFFGKHSAFEKSVQSGVGWGVSQIFFHTFVFRFLNVSYC